MWNMLENEWNVSEYRWNILGYRWNMLYLIQPHIDRMYKKFYRISKASFLDTLCVDTSHPTTRSVRGVHKTTECDHVSPLTTISVLLRLRRFRDVRIDPSRLPSTDGIRNTESCRRRKWRNSNIKNESNTKT